MFLKLEAGVKHSSTHICLDTSSQKTHSTVASTMKMKIKPSHVHSLNHSVSHSHIHSLIPLRTKHIPHLPGSPHSL